MRHRGRSRAPAGRRFLAPTGGSAPQFTPASPSGNVDYWVASPSYCFSDDAGTTPCGIGDVVAVWKGVRGLGANFTQGTNANRPTLQQDVSGHYLVRFDATNDGLASTNSQSGDSTLAVCAKQAGTTASTRVLNSGTTNSLVAFHRTTDQIKVFTGATVFTSGTNVIVARTGILTKASGGNWEYYLQGVSQTVTARTADWGTVALGAGGSTAEPLDGDVYGISLYNSHLSAADALLLHNFLIALAS